MRNDRGRGLDYGVGAGYIGNTLPSTLGYLPPDTLPPPGYRTHPPGYPTSRKDMGPEIPYTPHEQADASDNIAYPCRR